MTCRSNWQSEKPIAGIIVRNDDARGGRLVKSRFSDLDAGTAYNACRAFRASAAADTDLGFRHARR